MSIKALSKMHLKMSSAAYNCLILLANLSIEANSVNPDQTDPTEAVWSGFMLFVKENISAVNKTNALGVNI